MVDPFDPLSFGFSVPASASASALREFRWFPAMLPRSDGNLAIFDRFQEEGLDQMEQLDTFRAWGGMAGGIETLGFRLCVYKSHLP